MPSGLWIDDEKGKTWTPTVFASLTGVHILSNHPPAAVKSILECLGLPSRPPPIAPATSITEKCATDLEEKGARLC